MSTELVSVEGKGPPPSARVGRFPPKRSSHTTPAS